MNFSDKELKSIEAMASLYLTPSDIATMLNVPTHELRVELKRSSSPAAQAYQRGKVATKITLRKLMMQLAKVGSPLALENARQALIDMEDDE